MTRLYRCADAVVMAAIYIVAGLACCPLLVMDGVRRLLHKLGMRE